MSSIFSPRRWEDTAQRAFQRERTITAWVLAEWVTLRIGVGLAVLCGIGGVLGQPCQFIGDVGTAGGLREVESRGLGPGAHRAVRSAAVAQAAAKERAR